MMYRRLAIGLALAGLFAACFSESIEDRFKRGIGFLFENRYEEAESLYLAIASELKASNSPEAVRIQARALYQAAQIEHLYLNQPRRAVTRFHEVLKIDPEAPFAFDAQREIVTIYQERLMDYRAAAEELEKLVSAFPQREDIAEYQYRGAQCYFWLREFNQARVEAKVLLQKKDLGGLAALAQLLIANSYSMEGRYQEAVEAYQALINSNPEPGLSARAQFELGLSYQELGDIPRAEKALLEALKKHPRPDLVQAQLSNLRERFAELDSPKRSGKGGGEARHEPPKTALEGATRNLPPPERAISKPKLEPNASGAASKVKPDASTLAAPATTPESTTAPPAPGIQSTNPEKTKPINGTDKQPQTDKNSKPPAPESLPDASVTNSNGG